MIVRRFFDPRLAQTSYLLGCGRMGVGIVIDPHREIDLYRRAAESEGLAITHVTETHIHADFVSGARALSRSCGAELVLSDEGGPDWRYAYAAADGARLVRHGDRIRIGNVVLEVVHTPGHTPEHISFLVTDTAAADAPIAIVTGDFVFVGDVGRPDLLERAAGGKGTMEPAARALARSLSHFREYPDWLQIWPGHGAGSACGKGLSSVPHSTVGYERRFNWALGIADESAFVREVLAGQPEPPRYFAEMKRLNRDGPPLELPAPAPRGADSELAALVSRGEWVVDTRPAAAHAAGSLPGALSLPLSRSFCTYAGTLLPYDRDLHLIVAEPAEACAAAAMRDLAMIGLDRVAAWYGVGALAGAPLATLEALDPAGLASRLERGGSVLVDVRGATEWEEARIPGARHIPLGDLASRAGEFPPGAPVMLHCRTGARSAIAASLLTRLGVRDVSHLAGGIEAWKRSGREVIAGGPKAAEVRS